MKPGISATLASLYKKVGGIKEILEKDHGIDDSNKVDFYDALEDYHRHLKQNVDILHSYAETSMDEDEPDEDEYPEEEGLTGVLEFDETEIGDVDSESGWLGDESEEDPYDKEFVPGQEPDEDVDIFLTLRDALTTGGISRLEQQSAALMSRLAGYSADNIYSKNSHLFGPMGLFIRELGLKTFVGTDWRTIIEAVTRDLTLISDDSEGEESGPIQSGGRVEWDDLTPRRPVEMKFKSFKDFTPEQNIYINLKIDTSFFRSDSSPETYSTRLAAAANAEGVDALTFHEAFSEIGSDATGYTVEDVDGEQLAVVSLGKIQSINQSIISKLSRIKSRAEDLKQDLNSASLSFTDDGFTNNVRRLIEDAEAKRQILSDELDDLSSAIKRRDEHVSHEIYTKSLAGEFGADELWATKSFLFSRMLMNSRTEVFGLLNEVVRSLVFADLEASVYHLRGLRFGASASMASFAEEWDRYSDAFEQKIDSEIERKIRNFFNKQNAAAWAAESLCFYLTAHISRDQIREAVVNVVSERVTTNWNYTNCSMCGKTIYTKKGKETFGVNRSAGAIDSAAYSEYKVQLYGLTRMDGSIITPEMLKGASEDGEVRVFDAPPTLAQDGAGPKTWDEISEMTRSGTKAVHIEGVKRQSWALQSLGAKKVPGGEINVSDRKFKCPYSNINDRPQELRDKKIEASDFKCGVTLDIAPLLSGAISPDEMWRLQSTKYEKDYIDSLEKTDAIESDIKEKIIEELKRRRAGGWKFSNKYFNCPTRIEVGENDDEELLLKKFSFIASPISGPYTSSSVAYIDSEDGATSVDHESSLVYPPGDGAGGLSRVEDGTLSYLVCGAHVSASSFDRSSFAELIKSMLSETTEGLEGLVEAMVYTGVDVNDLIPFLSNANSVSDVIDNMSTLGRKDSLSELLKFAMASPMDLEKQVGKTGLTRKEILQNLTLVCRHGHKFTVKDSLYFGRTHTGINLTSRRGAVYKTSEIARSGLISTQGPENFEISTRIFSKQGDNYIAELSPEDLLGSDSDRYYRYEEWVDKVNKVKKVAFFSPSGERVYTYAGVWRDYIWGSEQRSKWTTVRSKETKDPKTVVFIESAIGLTDSMDDQRDGKGLSAQGRAASTWADDEDDVYVIEKESAYLADEESGVKRITAPVGDALLALIASCKDFLKMSTTLEIEGRLIGDPVLFRERYAEDVEAVVSSVVRSIVGLNNTMSPHAEDILDGAMSSLRGGLLNAIQEVDSRFLAYLGKSFQRELLVEIIKSVIIYVEGAYGPEAASGYKKRLYSRESGGTTMDIQAIRLHPVAGGTIGDALKEVTTLMTATVSSSDATKISDPTNTSDKIIKMRGQEYMGRLIAAACAFYLADAITRIYNMYMKDEKSMLYIGYDIGLDLSSIEKVLALTDQDERALTIGVGTEGAKKIDSLRRAKERYKNSSGDNEVLYVSAWYGKHYNNIANCLKALRMQTSYVMSACTSRPYHAMAVDYIRDTLQEVVETQEKALGAETPDSRKAKNIINTVLTTAPFTTMDVGSSGKYSKLYQGVREVSVSRKTGKKLLTAFEEEVSHELIPPFSAVIADYKGPEDYYPIYVLTEKGIIHHNFGIDIPEPPSSNTLYVLCKKEIPGSVILSDILLPDAYSGWKVLSIDTRDKNLVFNRTKDRSFKNEGIKRGVSLINHPATIPIIRDGVTIGYSNSEFSMDTSVGFFAGSMATRSGADLAFPPTQMGPGTNSVGIPLPIDYDGQDAARNSTDIPVVEARIPISMLGSEPGPMINVEMSDFLQRSPKDEAFRLLREIEGVYEAYLAELGDAKVVDIKRYKEEGATALGESHLLESEKLKIKKRYRRVTRKLFDQYRGLPYHLVKTACGTKTERASMPGVAKGDLEAGSEQRGLRYSARNSYYIPFVDSVLMHRLLTRECFSPEWGGHQLWSASDVESEVENTKDAVEQFIIDAHGLDVLTNSLIRELDKRDGQLGMNVRGIHMSDLLDPFDRLIQTGKISVEEAASLFGLKMENVDKYGYRVGFNNNSSVIIAKKFGRWAYSPGKFYSVGQSQPGTNTARGAYIKMMNTIFPRAKDRPRISEVQNPESSSMMSVDDMYEYTTRILRGNPNTSRFFLNNEGEIGGGVKVKKSGGVIGAYLYASAIGEYLRKRLEGRLLDIKDLGKKSSSIYLVGHIKYSEKLKTDMYSMGIVMDEGLMDLWKLLTNK